MSTVATYNDYPMANPLNKHELGLTKREYFAAMAMQGLINENHPAQIINEKSEALLNEISKVSVNAADALITALNKQP